MLRYTSRHAARCGRRWASTQTAASVWARIRFEAAAQSTRPTLEALTKWSPKRRKRVLHDRVLRFDTLGQGLAYAVGSRCEAPDGVVDSIMGRAYEASPDLAAEAAADMVQVRVSRMRAATTATATRHHVLVQSYCVYYYHAATATSTATATRHHVLVLHLLLPRCS